jgi:CBS domain-containing protein
MDEQGEQSARIEARLTALRDRKRRVETFGSGDELPAAFATSSILVWIRSFTLSASDISQAGGAFMSIGEFCNRTVIFATRSMSIAEAAQLMRRHHVGDLVVVDEADGRRVPVGVVTDRDIAIEIVAKSLDFNDFKVADIMSPQLVTVREDDGVFETVRRMRAKGIRRIPVVNREGGLVGIVSADDMLDLLAEEITELAKVAPREREREAGSRT